ncbi:uncharacterized protein MICPUCDRAFT_48856 [Micromonas pusilla CCMP1545]|uniref:30S ribosomal protein S16, chloroplastic n=1 Tax=Micromonas pusilla (strain CCMP1545) TaxID=564608 RepID=C1N670_MICPC|nr:uncharacterized protein MICPUCDRAFT_48856 [Micromonas pusilla CCMP1545]EEH52621.1 predicted protein [Micromonas pusilla CCMP1545]|eukprot:XP_003063485.1 predicted protein [Micromonas pusilla CCMP1545]
MAFAMSATSASLSFGRNVASTQGLRVTAAPSSNVVVPRPALKTEAMVKIRFTRLGRKRTPFYRIIAIDSRKRRDGAPLEELGWYDPIRKQSNLNAPAIKAWLSKGAQPSETVGRLLKKSLIMD